MHIAPPRFRPWRILFAIVFSYLLSGFVYEFGRQVGAIFRGDGDMAAMIVIPGALLDTLMALATLLNLGLPLTDGEHQINLYPIIIPVAFVSLAFATGAVRLGPKSPRLPGPTDPETGATAHPGPLSQ